MNTPHQSDQHSRTDTHQLDLYPVEGKNHLWDFSWIPRVVRLIYVFLFTYTGYSKLNDIESFTKGIRKVPFFGNYPEAIGWGIPILELILAIGMILPFRKAQRISFKVSIILMGVFTLYLLLMITLVKEKLCHCGGVIGSLGWTEHLIFNSILLLMGWWTIRKNN